ncbi:hypothetical protein RF11_08722 [Thelohanellus kitauei]|uniref:Uncharacterized protein n=1 Tax=Thelohanellus kitauei TaxID=669202 RepID=A0A0C2M9Q9_THEKT|nr:hypothetical protein RF11_08722 [Thelohanellus kitauei]
MRSVGDYTAVREPLAILNFIAIVKNQGIYTAIAVVKSSNYPVPFCVASNLKTLSDVPIRARCRLSAYTITINPEPAGGNLRLKFGLLVLPGRIKAEGVFGEQGKEFVSSYETHECEFYPSRRGIESPLLRSLSSTSGAFFVSAEHVIFVEITVSLVVARSRMVFNLIASPRTSAFESQTPFIHPQTRSWPELLKLALCGFELSEFVILSPLLVSVNRRVQPHRANGIPLGCMPKFIESESLFRFLISASVGTVMPCQPVATLCQSWFSSESKTRVYTAAVDLCLKGSKYQYGHLKATEESKRGNQDSQCLSLARESERTINVCTLALGAQKRLLPGDWPYPGS